MAESPVRAGPTLITAAATSQTVLTAGAASTWMILREINVCNETTGPVTFSIGIGTSNTDAAGKRLVKGKTIQTGSDPWAWGGFQVLAGHATTPDLVYVVCDVASGVTVTVGYVSGP